MANKGFVNPDTKIMADDPVQPYIRDEGGITDVVSEHIADIVADRAEEVFAKEETRKAMNNKFELIVDIECDSETLAYNVDNISKYNELLIEFVGTESGETGVNCAITVNNNFILQFSCFSGNTVDNTRRFIIKNNHGRLTASFIGASSSAYVAVAVDTVDNGFYKYVIEELRNLALNFNNNLVGGEHVKIWGV